MAGDASVRVRQRLTVTGIVQGVGFRPFVYRLAHQHQLAGFVGNDSQGVFIEVEGTAGAIQQFIADLQAHPPPLAHIEGITRRPCALAHEEGFTIVRSAAHSGAHTLISPDLCVCEDCLREMHDPADRRYRYPFINCTHCGPRFTIIRDVPYDRPYTTMVNFEMCAACQAEYDDPRDRRFHAQPNACPDCGPQVRLLMDGATYTREDAIQRTIAALHAGAIVAIKGIGGFHLACTARDTGAVQRLRQRKGRPGKPFAVMVRDLAMARELAHIDATEADLLTSRERPIVLLPARMGTVAPQVAPHATTIGLMLPYTPLHALLVDMPLVMTSANYSQAPIISDDETAVTQLAPLVDAFLLHDRAIHVPCDDSVMRVYDDAPYPVRRSRGYAPFPVKLMHAVPSVLAVGGELKSTFCLTKDDHAFMSQHIGDMANLETLDAFEQAYQHMTRIFRVQPQAIACDAHPRYLSTQWARRYARDHDLPLVTVQHHHAHIASVMAEHGLTDPVIGFSYDGTGYGDDGAIWGGEALIADYDHAERVAHLPYMPLAGGDRAIEKPYRLALAYLWANGIDWDEALPPVQHASASEQRVLRQQLARGLNVVPTSSMGRLFDVVAALIGVRQTVSYEAQAAIELEAQATVAEAHYPLPLLGTESLAPLLNAIIHDRQTMTSIAEIAGKFHNTIALDIVTLAKTLRDTHQIARVALSGGVFHNQQLLRLTIRQLQRADFEVFVHRRVPANDGGLALGQAVIASRRWG